MGGQGAGGGTSSMPRDNGLNMDMIDAGLEDNDLLVIDRSLEPSNNKIAVCLIDGEFTVKRLRVEKERIWLQPENPSYSSIEVTEENQLIIWGIVTNVIKKV